jgi:hypothetical protein
MLKYFGLLSLISSYIPLLFSIIRFKTLEKKLRPFILILLIAAVIDITVMILRHNKLNNLWLISIVTLIEGIAFPLLYFTWSRKSHLKFFFKYGALLFLVYWLVMLFFNSIWEFDTVNEFVKGVFVITASILMLFELSSRIDIELSKLAEFWICIGVLLYSASTLVIFTTAAYAFDETRSIMNLTWWMHGCINIVTNFVFTIALICSLQRSKSYLL